MQEKQHNPIPLAVILGLLAFIQFVHILDFIIIMPLGDTLMKTFDLSPGQFSVVVSAYSASSFIIGLGAAFFIDSFNKKKFLLVAFLGFTAGTVFCAFAESYWMLVFARIFTGLFGGSLSALSFAIVGELTPYEKRGRAMGVVMSAFSFASVAGIPLSLYLVAQYGWNAPFFFLGGLCAIIILMIIFILPSMPVKTIDGQIADPLSGIKNVLAHGNQQLALLFMLLLVLGQFTVITFIVPYLERNVGFDKASVSLVYAIGGSITLVSNPIVGRLADRFGRKRLFTVYALLSILPFVFITHLPPVEIWVALIGTGAFFMFVSGRFVPAQTIMTSMVLPENRGSFMSLTSSVQSLGLVLAATISGLVMQEGADGKFIHYNWVGYIAVGLTFVALFLLPKLKESETQVMD
jgi:predicted MFS family arabinose efflux permease